MPGSQKKGRAYYRKHDRDKYSPKKNRTFIDSQITSMTARSLSHQELKSELLGHS